MNVVKAIPLPPAVEQFVHRLIDRIKDRDAFNLLPKNLDRIGTWDKAARKEIGKVVRF